MGAQQTVILRQLGLQDYQPIWQAMQDFTNTRDASCADEIWMLQHNPVFTQGQAGKEEHLLAPGDIPVIQVDRGGQVTYHGPGQLIVYLLLDLKRNKLGVRNLVTLMEQGIVTILAEHGIQAYAKPDAPGVYVEQRKIASLGLRVRRGCSFHGLALNLNLDTAPFLRINPCGYPGMEMANMSDYVAALDNQKVSLALVEYFIAQLGYPHVNHSTQLS